MTEQQRAAWISSTLSCCQVNNAMQKQCGVSYDGGEHKQISNARIEQDHKDAIIAIQYHSRNPFSSTRIS